MNTINTLTVNGQSYALPDPRSVLDDSAASPDSTWSSQKLAAMDASASIVCQAGGKAIAVSDASDRAPVGLTVYGKTTQNGTPTPESPIALESPGAGGSIGVTVAGKNLLPYPYVNSSKTVGGITFTDNGDGSVTVKGTATAQVFFNILGTQKGIYLIGSVTTKNAQSTAIYLPHSNITIRDVTVQQSETGSLAYIYVDKGVSVDKTYYPRIELGATTATETQWEPYKPAQSLTLSTPNGLPGIPVASGGNYTDETGQAWICDEIDLTRGVYVRRLSVIESYAGEAVSGAYMSTTGELSQGASVLYALEGPTETALSAAELAAYAALHTVKPNTTVYNDASAHMELRYVADTKAYIDRKLAALAREVTA